MCVGKHLKQFSFFFHFISIHLTCRKASETLNIGQAITPTCFQIRQYTAVLSKYSFWFFNFIEIELKFGTACQNRQQRKVPQSVFYKDTKSWRE